MRPNSLEAALLQTEQRSRI